MPPLISSQIQKCLNLIWGGSAILKTSEIKKISMPPVMKICGARLSGHPVVEEKSTINIRGYMMCACVGSV